MTEGGARPTTAWAWRPLPPGADPLACSARLRGGSHPWLLDSALPSHPLARFSFAGAEPYAVLRGFAGPEDPRVEIACLRAARPDLPVGRRACAADPLETARRLLPPPPADGGPPLPFAGGAVGYLGYELARDFDRLRLRAADDLGLPDLVLLYVDRLLAFDLRTGQAWALGLGFGATRGEARGAAEEAAEALASRVDGASGSVAPRDSAAARLEVSGHFDESSYAKAVEQIRERIALGDVYQACLTQRLEAPFDGDPWELYVRLRALNPAPFAAFLELPELAIVGSSPERFLRVDARGAVESRPIKGTRPRGATPAEDAALRRDLARSEKDRAENLMIVDLVRNDLGRVCEIGSVRVPELFRIEAFASVFQMVSTVTGRLRPGRDVFDLVRAAFPPGSMTGAPKLAAMEILDALEPVRRGVYAGALGYLDLRGGADLAVVIRTLLVRGGRAYLHAGGGVVADSDPRAEHRESLDKARPLLDALAGAGAPSGSALHPGFSALP